MSESSMDSSSRTNWERLDALTDDEIDTSDSPPLSEEFFAKAQWLLPGESLPRQRAEVETVKVEIDLDSKTWAWFQSQGADYERRMLAALRLYAEAHQAVR
ncbi:MAG: BrnA antitoxin family protein [Armatimonadota bacterium]|nr:BrnA antitoxin family protein [Armatimonadota bacterium]